MRILAAARDPLVLRQLVQELPAEWTECEVIPAPTEEAVYDRLVRYDPEVVLLSSHLEDGRLAELLGRLRDGTDAPILILGEERDELAQARAFAAGADDWLDPPLSIRIVAAHVRAVLRRLGLPARQLTLADYVLGELMINRQTQQARWCGQPLNLTAREFCLLCALVEHAGHVVPSEELADHATSLDGESPRTPVRTLISGLRAKLDCFADAPTFIETVPGIGYRWIYRAR
jgi:DNA-binding response OmpR family regulator